MWNQECTIVNNKWYTQVKEFSGGNFGFIKTTLSKKQKVLQQFETVLLDLKHTFANFLSSNFLCSLIIFVILLYTICLKKDN